MAKWLELRTLDYEILGSNSMLLCKISGILLYSAPVHSVCMNEYLAIHSGGYLCMNSVRVLTAV